MSMIDWAKRELDLAGYAESDDPDDQQLDAQDEMKKALGL